LKAFLKQTRISSKKVNIVAALVRGKKVSDALTQLKFTPKRSAPVLAKLIASAAANAENNFKQDKEKLIISKIIVNEGMILKRGRPISRGRWHSIKKRTAKVWVELEVESKQKEAIESKKEKVRSKKSIEKIEPKVKKVKTVEKVKKEAKGVRSAELVKKTEEKAPPATKVESQKADSEKSETKKDS